MRRADRWAWLVVVALPVAAARGEDRAAETVLQGTVVDEAGKPAAGVVVEPLGREFRGVEAVRTGADGGFELRAGRVARPLAFAAVRARGDGERLGVASIRFRAAGVPAGPMRVVLAPSRPLTVRVKDGAGKPVAGAAVEVVTSEIASGRPIAAVDPGTTDEGGVGAGSASRPTRRRRGSWP